MTTLKLTGKNDLLYVVLPAAARGNLAGIRKLLKRDPSWIYAIGPHGRTMLWEAAYKARMETVEFLLEHGYIDRIVRRADLKSEIARAIDYCGK